MRRVIPRVAVLALAFVLPGGALALAPTVTDNRERSSGTGGPLLARRTRVPRAVLVGLFVVATLLVAPNAAYASCSTGSYFEARSGAGGLRDWAIWETGPQAASTYLNSYLPDPVVHASSAWVMMARQYNQSPSLAQTGWLRAAGWPDRYLFSQTWVPGYQSRTVYIDGLVPSGNHLYELDYLGWASQYIYLYDGVQWDQTLQNVTWQPARVEFGSESLNYQDHFPGSTANKVEFFGAAYKRLENWYSAGLSYPAPYPSSIAGLEVISGSWFRTYDKRCSD